MSQPAGRISVVVVDGVCEVELAGEIDAALRDQASESMVEVLASQGKVVVDAAHVTFMDSTGLAYLFQLKQVAAGDGRELLLRNPPRVLTDLIELTEMPDALTVDRS